MATTHTTLAAALSSSALDLIATAATGATVGGLGISGVRSFQDGQIAAAGAAALAGK